MGILRGGAGAARWCRIEDTLSLMHQLAAHTIRIVDRVVLVLLMAQTRLRNKEVTSNRD